MTDDVTLSETGTTYGIGLRDEYYGIWRLASPTGAPLERFEASYAGWYEARARFHELEATARERLVRRDSRAWAAALVLLVVGIALGIVSLFPTYLQGASLWHQQDDLVAHLIYLAAWAISAALLGARTRLRRAGALFGIGTSAVTLGLFLTDGGTAITYGIRSVGAGFWLALAGWALAASGGVAGILATRHGGELGAPRPSGVARALLGALLALGVAITFAPAWDRFTLFDQASGAVRHLIAGNAFSNPGAVIAGDVVVMAIIVALGVVALSWRPVALGGWLLLGGLVPLAAQAVAAMVQLHTSIDPSTLGITPAAAAADRLMVSSGLTAAFYFYCGFVVALGIACVAPLLFARPAPNELVVAEATG